MSTELENTIPPPDREALLDELARCFVQAAVTRLMKELRAVAETPQESHLELQAPKRRRASGVPARRTLRTRRRRVNRKAVDSVKSSAAMSLREDQRATAIVDLKSELLNARRA